MASIDSRRSDAGNFSQLASSSSDLASHVFEPFLQLPHKGWCRLWLESSQIGVALAGNHGHGTT